MPYNYNKEDKILVALDCVVFGFDGKTLKVLLTRNEKDPHQEKWSPTGGFLKKNETLDDAASRILCSLTGKEKVFKEQLHAFSNLEENPKQGSISVVYSALVNMEDIGKELLQKNHAEWFSLSEVPLLIPDHNKILSHAIQKLQRRIRVRPVVFELLPEKFTFRQLQILYEDILNRTLDKRNFVNKIKSLDILTKLNEKDMSSSTKKSNLYTFKPWKFYDHNENEFYLKF